MTELIIALIAVVGVMALVALVFAVRELITTMRSVQQALETSRNERHHRREVPASQPTPRVVGSHPVIKVMAFKAGASRAARHLRGD